MKKRVSFLKILIIVLIGFWIYIPSNSFASSNFILRKINFDIVLNEDGNMDVTETWNISVEGMTNTLFKTFEIDSSKYKEITNVHVSEITDGSIKEFTQKNIEVTHVDKDCYYGLRNSNGQYEIAWGINEESGEKTYKIEYTVIGAIKNYADCSELYWQFIGKNFQMDVNEISGIIRLERSAELKEDIRAWAHGPINGNINIDSTNQVSFGVEFFDSGNFLEVRMALPNELFTKNNNTSQKAVINQIIEEETKWAQETNKIREEKVREQQIMNFMAIVFLICGSVYSIIKIKRSYNILIKNQSIKLPKEIEYYRDIPDENVTPAQEALVYYFNKLDFKSIFPKILSSTMLNLCLKGYLKFENDINERNKIEIRVHILEGTKTLAKDEEIIFNFLKRINKNSFTMKEMERYAKAHYERFYKVIDEVENEVKEANDKNKNYNRKLNEIGKKYKGSIFVSIFWIFITFILSHIIISNSIISVLMVWTFIIINLVQIIYSIKVSKRLITLTEKGLEEKEKLNGLKRFLEDFSMIDDKKVPELILWEGYLVYATLFGVADKVLKQLRIVYPQIAEDGFNYGNYLGLMYYSGFNNSFIHNLESSVNSAYVSARAAYNYNNTSSGSGSGGGFSVGGGGRRRCLWRRRPLKMSKKGEKWSKQKKKI